MPVARGDGSAEVPELACAVRPSSGTSPTCRAQRWAVWGSEEEEGEESAPWEHSWMRARKCCHANGEQNLKEVASGSLNEDFPTWSPARRASCLLLCDKGGPGGSESLTLRHKVLKERCLQHGL